MLKFFRKIRQQLLSENQFSKYLIYSLGEILLVMVGILLALQVNNWNEKRLSQLKSLEILKEIKRNVEENIQLTKEKIATENGVIKSADIILNNLTNTKTYHDSLDAHFHNSHFWPAVSIKSSGYETLKANGIDLISSDTLKEAIVNLYEVSYVEIYETVRMSENYSASTVVPLFTQLFRTYPKGIPKVKPIDYRKVVASENYQGVLSYWRGYRYYANEIRTNAIIEGEGLLYLINMELENLST